MGTRQNNTTALHSVSSGKMSTGKKSGRKKAVDLVFLIIITALIYPAYTGWQELYQNFLEKDEPTIKVQEIPAGIGSNPLKMRIDVADVGAGIDEVIVRSEQDGEIKELERVSYKLKKNEDAVFVNIDGREEGFREGEVKIRVLAFDRSLWSNKSLFELDLTVDYTPPRLAAITTQHNVVVGGVGLVFYRLDEKQDSFSGVKVGQEFFPGFLASRLDEDYKERPDVYFSFFAIPLEFDVDRDRIELFATDGVGNVASGSMYYRVQERKYGSRVVELSEAFLRNSIERIIKDYAILRDKLKITTLDGVSLATTPKGLVEQFRLINEDYRQKIETLAEPLFARPRASRLWTGVFSRLSGSASQSPFGEERMYRFGELDAGSSLHIGEDLASYANTSVRAANSGKVVFADRLGLYGSAIILDHGFGLYTLYAHLSDISAREGDSVNKGDVIGKTGNSGFAEGDHLHFEMRLHGVPVRPLEWWDARWIQEHIDDTITNTKKALGLKVVTRIEP